MFFMTLALCALCLTPASPRRALRRLSPPASALAPGVLVDAQLSQPSNASWVVGLGDSFMSGEGASWIGRGYAANSSIGGLSYSNEEQWRVIAYGLQRSETFPFDSPLCPFCHRSAIGPMFFGLGGARSGFRGKNLACSGARSASVGGKPGLDFFAGGGVFCDGQARTLQAFAAGVSARGESIALVLVSIGGNDLGFKRVATDSATRLILSAMPYLRRALGTKRRRRLRE